MQPNAEFIAACLAEHGPGLGLEGLYAALCAQPSDINEHLPTLRRLAGEAGSICEFGPGASTIALALGLAGRGPYLAVDVEPQPWIAEISGVEFRQADSREVAIPPVDLLFIDTFHTAAHLAAELACHGDRVRRIALHDTETFGRPGATLLEQWHPGDPGLWAAIDQFLASRPAWHVEANYPNCNGLTVLVHD